MFYGEPAIDALIFLALLYHLLMLAAWVYLYRKGTARDLIFWGAIAYFIPFLGAIAVFGYFRHRNKETF